MVAFSSKAGQNVRQMAKRRRWQSWRAFFGALMLPLLVVFMFPILALQLGFVIAISLVAIAVFGAIAFVFRGLDLWEAADRADLGARAEEQVAEVLQTLEPKGWEFQYGMRLDQGLGDADVICVSPRKKTYVIDVKSHKGTVIFQDHRLHRRMGRTIYPFKKDFLQIVMKQALQVRDKKQWDFVTPILVFTRAQLAVSQKKIRGVYVIAQDDLVNKLQELG
ncbi:nuclease-related domain-containing protein [[Limnothrix rosea] IAM M-220]|uniref:nuclease-related domain-containing protein n=1 Tax=[Limnothrix rosea] IAM M-220 TaxID=454133 RepID=UPI000963D628|nr:nuclease-related domain-containing protein [[Limnothrix rosea] IAM M-220]OKH15124.1 nuclease [[Limnothrix rosea] IAM M-220]